jgi:hypothetical protein
MTKTETGSQTKEIMMADVLQIGQKKNIRSFLSIKTVFPAVALATARQQGTVIPVALVSVWATVVAVTEARAEKIQAQEV